MNRRLFSILSVLSLLICFAISALCVGVRMGWSPPAFRWDRGIWFFVASAGDDAVYVSRGMVGSRLGENPELILPYLVLIPALAIAPVAWVVRTVGWRIRTARRRAGRRCVECGYDLRESAQRCPECGAVGLHHEL